MGLYLLLAFTVVPLAELWLLARIWDATSFGFTICLVLLTGVVGAALARMEGLRVIRRIQDEFSGGGIPGRELLEGAMILVAGVLLVTPGVMTDFVGFVLLIGPVRRWVGARLFEHFRKRVTVIHTSISGGMGGAGNGGANPDGMVDVEATVVENGDEAVHSGGARSHNKMFKQMQIGRDR